MIKTELKKQALALPVDERMELVDSLLEECFPPVTEEQRALINEGWASYVADPSSAISEEEADAKIVAHLKK